jgi:hypothetical protein
VVKVMAFSKGFGNYPSCLTANSRNLKDNFFGLVTSELTLMNLNRKKTSETGLSNLGFPNDLRTCLKTEQLVKCRTLGFELLMLPRAEGL